MASPQVDAPTGWLVALVSAVLGSSGFWLWWTERLKLRRSAPAALTSADAEMVKATGEAAARLIDAGGELNDDYRHQLKFVRGELERLQDLISSLSAKVDDTARGHEDCERRLRLEKEDRARDVIALRAELAQLMANPPADY